MKHSTLTLIDIDRIVEMAWEERPPFDAIEAQFGLKEQQVIALIRTELKPAKLEKMEDKSTGPRHQTLQSQPRRSEKIQMQSSKDDQLQ